MNTKVHSLVVALTKRLEYSFTSKRSNAKRAGCSSEEYPGELNDLNNAYVAEPILPVRNSKDIRALILCLFKEEKADVDQLKSHLLTLLERCQSKKEVVFEKLSISLNFLINDLHSRRDLNREAVFELLGYTERSYQGNDEKRALGILEKFKLRISARQRSKVRRSSQPKRPKERAEPAHLWLPSWEKQYLSASYDDQPEYHISELLSPSELIHYLRR